MSLMTSRRFAPLFWCQFFSAFNDNFLRYALVFLILFRSSEHGGGALIAAAGGIFIAPSVFLSGLGGELADRYDKAVVARWLKLVEVGVAAIAVVGFLAHSIAVLLVTLFLFGVISTLFGPAVWLISLSTSVANRSVDSNFVPAGARNRSWN